MIVPAKVQAIDLGPSSTRACGSDTVASLVTPHRARSFYKPELDVLRFFAFFAVFLFHTINYSSEFLVQNHVPLWVAKIGLSSARAGKYGVDLFFILSAYLITELLLRERESTGTLDIGAFYLRRVLRIWPLSYLLIALVALVPFLNPNREFSLRYVIAFFLFVGNWSFIVFGHKNFLTVPLWSVAVEEQFYLLWPPVVARLTRRQITSAAIGLICVANIVRPIALAIHQGSEQLWMNSFAHLDSIAVGILLAVHWRGSPSPLKHGVRLALLFSGVGSLVLIAHFANTDAYLSRFATLAGSAAVPLACAGILVSFFNLPFRLPVLQYLGKISYGLYAYHFTGLFLVDKLLPGGGSEWFMLARG